MAEQHEKTNAVWKLANSIVNVCFVFLLSLPFLFLSGFDTLTYKLIVVILFLAYELTVAFTPKKMDLGDLVTGSRWVKKYSLRNHVTFAFLYSVSFSTTFIWIFFPFDLLIINLLLVQLPFILKTGYTLHGYLSGKMAGTREIKKTHI